MPRLSVYKKTRHLNRSVKISSEIYESLVSLQGLLQLKERQKRSMDELIEFILSFVPKLEINASDNYYSLEHRTKEQGT